MGLISIFLIALGLSMDAASVAVTDGMIINNLKISNALKIAFYFGTFQAVMPVLGYFGGINFTAYLEQVDHYIAFGLLAFIGIKMIHEALSSKHRADKKDPLKSKNLFIMAIATSIDALAVGLTLATIEANISLSVLIIGCVTFVNSFLGVYIGKRFGNFFSSKAEISGGVILILIGTKILIEHLFF